MENQKTTIPKWFWAVAIFSLLWNLMGVSSFYLQVSMTGEALKTLSLAEQELYNSYPLWTFIAFAFAVFGGIIGSVGLLMKKKWAKPAFIISLLAIIPQMIQNLFFTNAREVYGPGTEVMPILVIIFGVFLVWFSTFGIRKGWLK
ncbi:hypothetical protein SAMN05443667_101672 [Flavobacterium gillisiae]|uniref:Sugar transporter n=1 Tax=Flavobacterium gillisiae TaxID=150146 RepID=A0A1H3XUU0_9FLAO|nr:hypothetical protein [Flavobacterium gillisiae]SEA03093.1 hypothetical protein SAMN05443667_101672 [Flavobacterium gillisiae]